MNFSVYCVCFKYLSTCIGGGKLVPEMVQLMIANIGMNVFCQYMERFIGNIDILSNSPCINSI